MAKRAADDLEAISPKRLKPDDGGTDATAAQALSKSAEIEDKEEEEEEEEGEIIEEANVDATTRAARAWILDLMRPPKQRVHRHPLEFACERAKPIDGLWMEFGVFSGTTINMMARHKKRGKVYGFDTFEGLPEDWRDTHKKGHFDCKGKFPPVANNVELVKGLFQDTLEPFLKEHSAERDSRAFKHISVAHLDADLYSATIYVLQVLAPRVVVGTLLVFDELINYPGFEEHEWKALIEAVREFGWEVEFVAQSAALESPVVHEIRESQQVALRITKINK